MFMNRDVVQTFLDATNEYAEMVDCKSWKMLEEKEFLAFLVIIIYMGVVKLPERAMYWQRDSFGQDSPENSCQQGALNRYSLIGTGLLCLRVREQQPRRMIPSILLLGSWNSWLKSLKLTGDSTNSSTSMRCPYTIRGDINAAATIQISLRSGTSKLSA